jgi:hypothetical protein
MLFLNRRLGFARYDQPPDMIIGPVTWPLGDSQIARMLVVETRDLRMHQMNSQKEHWTKSRESKIAMKAIGCGMRLASIFSDRRTYSRRVRRMRGTIGPNRG